METNAHHNLPDSFHHEEETTPTQELVLNFFQTFGATGSRKFLWDWYRTTVSGEYHLLEPLEMTNLVQFYDALDELFEQLAGE